MSNDLLGFPCEFAPGMRTPKQEVLAHCRTRWLGDSDLCPGIEHCKKPEACRVKDVNKHRLPKK